MKKGPSPSGAKETFPATLTVLLRRDLHVRRNIRVPALLAARIDGRSRVAIRLPIHHVGVRIQGCRGKHRIDLRKRPARRARIQRTIRVVPRMPDDVLPFQAALVETPKPQ